MRIFSLFAILIFAACGGGGKDTGPAGTHASEQKTDKGRVTTSKKLNGTLYYTYADPLASPATHSLDLKKKRYKVVSNGIRTSARGEQIAFVDFCSPLSVRVSVIDGDGFMNPVTECIERETISGQDYQAPVISPDGKKVAVVNYQIRPPKNNDDPNDLMNAFGFEDYAATQVYDMDGNLLAQFKDMGPATWDNDGRLVMGGMGGDAGYGIYRADKKLKNTKRVDNGKLKDTIWSLDAHPSKDRVAFIFNGQLFDMSLKDGNPKRLHQHGHLLSGIAYSPDGKQIAMVSNDTLEEGLEMAGSGYPIFVYDDGKVHNVMLPFVIAGPLDWTK